MLHYTIYNSCFSHPEMAEIWSEKSTICTWLQVEKTLAHAQFKLEIIPVSAYKAINKISYEQLNLQALQGDMLLVGRPIVGLIKQMRKLTGTHGDKVHFNATTQDIIDTALMIQIKQSVQHIKTQCDTLIAEIDRLIHQHADVRIMGRTNGQHAVPMRLVTKLQVWQSELTRRYTVLQDIERCSLCVQIGGAVGELSDYDMDTAHALKQKMASLLGLHAVSPHWQNARDMGLDMMHAVGALCASLCKIAHNINLLSSSDIGEMSESYVNGQGASSTMPHKKNQRSSEFMEITARLGRQRTEQMGELSLHQHERSGGVWLGEWLIIPETLLLTSGALKWGVNLFENLHIHADTMSEKI